MRADERATDLECAKPGVLHPLRQHLHALVQLLALPPPLLALLLLNRKFAVTRRPVVPFDDLVQLPDRDLVGEGVLLLVPFAPRVSIEWKLEHDRLDVAPVLDQHKTVALRAQVQRDDAPVGRELRREPTVGQVGLGRLKAISLADPGPVRSHRRLVPGLGKSDSLVESRPHQVVMKLCAVELGVDRVEHVPPECDRQPQI